MFYRLAMFAVNLSIKSETLQNMIIQRQSRYKRFNV